MTTTETIAAYDRLLELRDRMQLISERDMGHMSYRAAVRFHKAAELIDAICTDLEENR